MSAPSGPVRPHQVALRLSFTPDRVHGTTSSKSSASIARIAALSFAWSARRYSRPSASAVAVPEVALVVAISKSFFPDLSLRRAWLSAHPGDRGNRGSTALTHYYPHPRDVLDAAIRGRGMPFA